MSLIYKNEKLLFRIALVLSALFWIILTAVTFGILLIYLLFGYLIFLFAHSAFISHLKGSGVKISEDQFPDLYEKLVKGCDKVGLNEIPEAYLLRTDYFNALATKFLGRYFVVLFTDVVDALEDQPDAIDFYIGHELGHIHRKHLSWSTFIMPASILPLLGTALRRAEEYTCDRYGVACCKSEDDIKAAIAAIAAGNTRWKSLNLDAYLQQVSATSGFWMSLNELTSDYPWLTKRMATSIALNRGEDIKHPKRHIFAWLLSLFIPRIGAGAGGGISLLITIAMIGILAAIAIPAYKDYTDRAKLTSAYISSQTTTDMVTEYVIEHNEWPESMQSLGYGTDVVTNKSDGFETSIFSDGIVGIKTGVTSTDEIKYLVLQPEIIENAVNWTCYGENIREASLPSNCK